MISGTLRIGDSMTAITDGRLRGDEITFTAGDAHYTGRVNGDSMEGLVASSSGGTTWMASHLRN
jgi:hypothetical protein